MDSKISTINQLREALIEWDDEDYHAAQVCQSFRGALFNLVSYIQLSLEGLSHKSKSTKKLDELNKKHQEPGISFGSVESDIVSSYIIPELYSFSLVGGWGLLEEFLRDVPFYIMTNTLSTKKPEEYFRINKTDIDTDQLAIRLISRTKNNKVELEKLYKDLLGVDLLKNIQYIELQKLRQKRHKIAHTGTLLGYHSLTRDILWKNDEFEKDLSSIQRNSGREFNNSKTRINADGYPEVTFDFRHYDPVESKTSKELEQDFCSTILLMRKLSDFLEKKLFSKI